MNRSSSPTAVSRWWLWCLAVWPLACGSPAAVIDGGLTDADAGAPGRVDAGSGVDGGLVGGDGGQGPFAPTSVAYSSANLSCLVGDSCSANAPTVRGGRGTFSVSPGLPDGLALDPSSGAISGTASVPAARSDFEVRVANSAGSASTTLSIEVRQRPPAGLAYPSSSLACTMGRACSFGPPTAVGGAIRSFSVSPSLPLGLSLDPATGVVSGVPTVLAAASLFTFTAENAGGVSNALITVSVVDEPPTGLTYPTVSLSCFKGVPCTSGTPSVTGKVDSFSVSPRLPNGLTVAANGGIEGTPTVAAASSTYTLRARNTGGESTFVMTLGVLALATVPATIDVSLLSRLNVTVGGTGLTRYRSKVVATAAECADPAGYSAEAPLTTPITDSVVDIVDATYTLCVVGADGTTWAPFSVASTARLVDATHILDGVLPSSNLTLHRVPEADAGALASGRARVFFSSALDAGTRVSAVCTNCEASVDNGVTWAPGVADAGPGLVVWVRHEAASTANTQNSTVLTWSTGAKWTLLSLTKSAPCLASDKRLFLSARTTTGHLATATTADELCQADATEAGLGGTWAAALSNGTSALSMLSTGRYCSLEGRELVVNRAFVAPLVTDVKGSRLNSGYSSGAASVPVKPREGTMLWVGGTDYTCNGWSSAQSADYGRIGAISAVDPTWGWYQLMTGGAGVSNCASSLRLLCYEK